MNYELVKQLLAAGYSWPGRSHILDCELASNDVCPHKYYYPTLEELIEACGERFSSLNRVIYPAGWSCDFEDENEYIEHTGVFPTPTEAVANLWIALNKTPTN